MGALGGTRTPSLLIRRVCRGFFLPGHVPLGLRGYRSLLCVVTQSYAVLYDQNQTTDRAHGLEVVGHHAAGWTDCHAASSVVQSQLITCLQSMAKMSSTVHGLAWGAPGIHLSTATSRRVGVGCGCQRDPLKSTLGSSRRDVLPGALGAARDPHGVAPNIQSCAVCRSRHRNDAAIRFLPLITWEGTLRPPSGPASTTSYHTSAHQTASVCPISGSGPHGFWELG